MLEDYISLLVDGVSIFKHVKDIFFKLIIIEFCVVVLEGSSINDSIDQRNSFALDSSFLDCICYKIS